MRYGLFILHFLYVFFFTATANIANVYLMRSSELQQGIDVYDQQGNLVGTSKVAAQKVIKDLTSLFTSQDSTSDFL